MTLPRLYAIIDVSCFGAPLTTAALIDYARELAAGGVTLIQYRNKTGGPREMLGHARELRRALPRNVTLVMNDRADLCLAADCDGMHAGQDDLSPAAARAIIGPGKLVGISTHTLEQLRQADTDAVDYIAFGPMFATSSKRNPDAVVGLEGFRRARAATAKPLVAIGGITRTNARWVVDAGADSIAVIADLVGSPRQAAEEFLRIVG